MQHMIGYERIGPRGTYSLDDQLSLIHPRTPVSPIRSHPRAGGYTASPLFLPQQNSFQQALFRQPNRMYFNEAHAARSLNVAGIVSLRNDDTLTRAILKRLKELPKSKDLTYQVFLKQYRVRDVEAWKAAIPGIIDSACAIYSMGEIKSITIGIPTKDWIVAMLVSSYQFFGIDLETAKLWERTDGVGAWMAHDIYTCSKYMSPSEYHAVLDEDSHSFGEWTGVNEFDLVDTMRVIRKRVGKVYPVTDQELAGYAVASRDWDDVSIDLSVKLIKAGIKSEFIDKAFSDGLKDFDSLVMLKSGIPLEWLLAVEAERKDLSNA